MNRRLIFSWLAILAAAFMLSGCDGSGDDDDSTSSNPTYLRLVNATTVSGLQFTATESSDSTVTTGASVDAVSTSGYVSLDAGSYSAFVSNSSGTLATSSTTSLSLSSDVYYTLVAYARSGQIRLLQLTDNQSAASSGYSSLTIANAGSDTGSLDVYVLAPGTPVTADLSPTFSSVTAGGSSLATSVASGTYDIIVTGYNKPTDVRLTMSSVILPSTGVFTLLLTGTPGGTLVDGAMIQQSASVVLYPANNARVRVVAALPAVSNSNAVVAATVGAATLNSVTSPAVGSYTQVQSNISSYSVRVNGVALATLPPATFATGGDYTLLVYGADAASAAVTVITDNNQVPSSGARIRLVNGAVSSMSLSSNYVPLFSDLTYGGASDYSALSTGSNLLRLTSPVTAFTTYSNTLYITSGSVYSLFVLGSAADAIEVLVKDK